MLKTLINRGLSAIGFSLVRSGTVHRLQTAEAVLLALQAQQTRGDLRTRETSITCVREILQEVTQNRLHFGDAIHAALKDISIAAQFIAATSSAQWLHENADGAPTYDRRPTLLDAVLPIVPQDGDFAEFGVFTGAVTRFIRPRVAGRAYHAFDSFRGVPGTMTLAVAKHAFDLGGVIPDLPPDTTVHAGWFEDTVPQWRAKFSAPIAFAYIDCDLYGSVRTVLEGIADRVRPGSILVFDDWYNFPNWQAHSLRAAQEFVENYGIRLEPLGFCTLEHAGAFRVAG
jgi:hypothetical protein